MLCYIVFECHVCLPFTEVVIWRTWQAAWSC